jgi:hypothetical protein
MLLASMRRDWLQRADLVWYAIMAALAGVAVGLAVGDLVAGLVACLVVAGGTFAFWRVFWRR